MVLSRFQSENQHCFCLGSSPGNWREPNVDGKMRYFDIPFSLSEDQLLGLRPSTYGVSSLSP